MEKLQLIFCSTILRRLVYIALFMEKTQVTRLDIVRKFTWQLLGTRENRESIFLATWNILTTDMIHVKIIDITYETRIEEEAKKKIALADSRTATLILEAGVDLTQEIVVPRGIAGALRHMWSSIIQKQIWDRQQRIHHGIAALTVTVHLNYHPVTDPRLLDQITTPIQRRILIAITISWKNSVTKIAYFSPVQHDVKLLDNLGEPCPVPGNNQVHFDDNILIITNNNDTNINKKNFF